MPATTPFSYGFITRNIFDATRRLHCFAFFSDMDDFAEQSEMMMLVAIAASIRHSPRYFRDDEQAPPPIFHHTGCGRVQLRDIQRIKAIIWYMAYFSLAEYSARR